MEKTKKNYTHQQLKNYGLWMLGRRNYSRKELSIKMFKFQDDKILIAEALDSLEKMQILNDKSRALSILNGYGKREGKSKIVYRMKQAGLSQDIIDEVYLTDEAHFDVSEKCFQMLERKYKTYSKDNYIKMSSFLGRKGFSYDDIKKAMEQFKKIN